jgi:hypothetical protein
LRQEVELGARIGFGTTDGEDYKREQGGHNRYAHSKQITAPGRYTG